MVRGEIKRLMVFAPPQHGKSQQVSVHLPAWWLGQRPDDPVILTSYASSLAESKSWQVRNLVESAEYAELFPGIRTDRASRAVGRWNLAAHRGGLLATGVGGPITGFGGLLGIIDDPLENWEQAFSQTIRNKVWEWYRTTFRTRIWEGGAIGLVMTRWHEDDLAGRLLQDQPGQWTVLRLPALAETQEERDDNNRRFGLPAGAPDPLGRPPGASLSPSRFSAEALAELQNDVGEMAWLAEYQGCPRPIEGALVKRDSLHIVDHPPADLRWVRYWDLALSEKQRADYTAGSLCAFDAQSNFYVRDVVRGHWEWPDARQVIMETAHLDGGRVIVGIEQVAFQSTAFQELLREPQMRGYPMRALSGDVANRDKLTRALPWITRAQQGRMYLVRGPWVQSYVDEICSFPFGGKDDQVDGTSGAYHLLVGGVGAVGMMR